MIRIPTSAAPDVQQAFRDTQAQLSLLLGSANINLHGRRVINAHDAIDPSDYTTRAELDRLVSAVRNDVARIQVPQTADVKIKFDTHANRLLTSPVSALGTFFFETDRFALYTVDISSGTAVWTLLVATMTGSVSGRPSDLGATDAGFVFYAQDQAVIYLWSGAVWHYECGVLSDTWTNRPAAGGTNISGGFRFAANDRGYQEWVYNLPSVRWEFAGGGEPLRGVISAITTGLGTYDAGYLYYATDFDRIYRWSGSAWADGAGQPTRGMISYFMDSYAPSTGWQLCDGTASVSISTATGSTTTVTVPNLTGSNRFIRSVSGTTGGTGGSATTHTHAIDPPNTTSTVESGDTALVVAIGAGTNVPSENHTHDVNIASFTSGSPSGTGGDDALPPWFNLRPYMRL